jgi:molecular chaperone DnaK/serine/threonine-protein kinase
MGSVVRLLNKYELRDALSVVYEQSDRGTKKISWQDVKDDITSSEWGRLIEWDVITSDGSGFQLSDPENVRAALEETSDELLDPRLGTVPAFTGEITTTVDATPTMIRALEADSKAVIHVLSGQLPGTEWQLAVAVNPEQSSDQSVSTTNELDGTDDSDTGSSNQSPDQVDELTDSIPTIPDPSLPDGVDYADLTIDAQVGQGGFAEVHKASLDRERDQSLAIKRLVTGGTLTKQRINQFVEAAETWDQVDGRPHVVTVVDWGKVPRPWITMEYMDGGDLGDRLRVADGEFPVGEGLWIASVLSETIAEIHHLGVRHFDLQPRNIMFAETSSGQWDIPKIGDWGLATAQLDLATETVPLNPRYAAPEQLETETDIDHRTDIYQLGAVVYELLTGQAPTATGAAGESIDSRGMPESPTVLRPSLPDGVNEVLLTALQPEPADRYDRMVYFRDALDGIIDM